MNKINPNERQAGAVSLLFTAVFMMLVTLLALSFLYSVRYGRWPMQDLWAGWSKSGKIDQIQQEIKGVAGQAIPSAGPQPGSEVRRCVVAGKVTYSNVECNEPNSGSRTVKLHDSQGIEAPKLPAPAEQQAEGEGDLRAKMVEKAISKSK